MLNPRLDGLADALFREAGDALFLFDPETGQILEVNPTAQRLSGFSRDELLAMQTTALIQSENSESQTHLRDAVQHSSFFFHARDGFLLRTTQDGVWIPVNLTITRLHLKPHTLGLITARDVRDQREAIARLRKFEVEMRRVLTSVTDFLWSAKIDPKGNWSYRYCSPVVEGITGRPPRFFIDHVGEPLKIRWGTIVDPRDRPRWEQAIQKIRDGQSVQEEYRVLRSDGRVCWVRENVRVSRADDRQSLLLDGVVTDVTAWRDHEAELRAAKESAEAANRAKSVFLANMSHEIRTPLNGILGMADLAQRTEGEGEQRRYLDALQVSAHSLLTVINDILDFSKIEAGKLELEDAPFSLRETITDALTVLAVRAHQKGLELSCHVRPRVPDALVGDASRLRQVLMNLVGNAVKFTRVGDVLLEVDVGENGGGPDELALHFRVVDSGIGIPSDKQQMIFDAFVQADVSSTKEYGGTGLGLSIASELVRRMDGQIWVHSAAGAGSTFEFTARMKVNPKSASDPEGGAQRQAVRGRRVLIVDDNEHSRRILADVLTGWGMQPRAVADAEQADEAFRRASQAGRPFDLLLFDAYQSHGVSVRPYWRAFQTAGAAAVPAVALLTTDSLGEDADRCRRMGVDAYVTKPVREAVLLTVLAGLATPAVSGMHTVPVVPRSLPSLRILLAEDNAVNQLFAASLLEQSGHSVRVTRNGREAVAAFEREPFDLALMDIEMPEMDGFAATAAIRLQEKQTGRHLPILALTAHAVSGFREQCLEAGMDGYLSKPVRSADLLDAVRRHAAGGGDAGPPDPPFDRAAALARLENKPDLLRMLIATYLRETPVLQGDLARAIRQRQPAQIQRAAQKWIEVLSVFSAGPARARAAQVNAAAVDFQRAADQFAELEREIASLNSALKLELGVSP